MKPQKNIDQRGQAMSEALFIAGVFLILIIGINTSMSMQLAAIRMLMDSVKNVFQVHLGNMLASENSKNFSSIEKSDLFSSSTHSIFEELSMAQPGFSHTLSESTKKIWDAKIISRQSFIEAGTGYASSDQAVQTRIGASPSLWRDAFKSSSNVMRPIHALTSKSDAAWSRPDISLDFIQPWAGVVPELSIIRSHKWRN